MTVIDLSGRVAVVTGASRGIGRAAAEGLLKAGCSVVLNARPSNEASASFAELEAAYPDRVTAVYGSVAESATATAIAQSAMSRHKRLDILVNNAGILRDKLIGMISDAEIDELFNVNVIGLIKITQLAARIMARRKSGSIINVSSIVGRRGNSGQTVYSATKSAVIGATFSAAKELAPMNIRVNAVAPGLIDTSMVKSIPEDRRKTLEQNIAMGRVGSPEDVANVILFLASDLSSYVTGQVKGLTVASSYDPPCASLAPIFHGPRNGLAMQRNSMRDLDFSCGGLLPLIAPLEREPAARDDRHDVWLTRDEIRTASLGLAENIASGRKRLVFLFCGATCETVIGLLAAAAAGHAVALVDPSLAEDKLRALIEAYQPELVLSTPDVGETLRDQASATGGWRSYQSRAGVVEWTETDDGAPSVDINPALQLLLSTSGTTGSQKYVRLSRDAIVANAGQIAEALAIDEHSIGIAHLPLHYSYGLSVVTSHLAAGGRVYLVNDSITSPSFWSKIANVGGSHFPGVPFHYAALARLGASLIPDSVKVFTQAGGALDPRIQAKMHDWATQRDGRFFVMYGQTEASPRMTTLQSADFSRKAGSVGVALAGGRLSIIDDKGAALPADAIGMVVYEGPNVMLGYAMSRADLDKSDEMKGRLETGDLGRVDAEGFLYLTGRTKRFAKIAGYRLGLDEIEQELFAVCSVACIDLGERIAVVHEQESEAALKARVRELAANYKVPSSSFSLLKTAQIPRGASGKINYAQLKESLRV